MYCFRFGFPGIITKLWVRYVAESGQGAAECAGTGKAYKERGKLRNFVGIKQLVLLGYEFPLYFKCSHR